MASGSSGSGHPESGPSINSGLDGASAIFEDVFEDDGPSLDRHLYIEEVLTMWNLARIIKKLGTNEQCVAFAEENGLVKIEKLCSTHRTAMKIAKSTNRSFGSWCCTKGNCKRKSKIPRNNGTFFENIKIDLVHVFYLLYAYSKKWSYNDVINEDPYKEHFERCLGRVTICDWYNYCRETIIKYQMDKNEAVGKIDGSGKIVQINESKFGKRKYNRDVIFEYMWRRNIMKYGKDPFMELIKAIKYVYELK